MSYWTEITERLREFDTKAFHDGLLKMAEVRGQQEAILAALCRLGSSVDILALAAAEQMEHLSGITPTIDVDKLIALEDGEIEAYAQQLRINHPDLTAMEALIGAKRVWLRREYDAKSAKQMAERGKSNDIRKDKYCSKCGIRLDGYERCLDCDPNPAPNVSYDACSPLHDHSLPDTAKEPGDESFDRGIRAVESKIRELMDACNDSELRDCLNGYLLDGVKEPNVCAPTGPNEMDVHCIELCHALNSLPGITTTESCCGHGPPDSYGIWFKVDSIDALRELVYLVDEDRSLCPGWRVIVTVNAFKDTPTFQLRGPSCPLGFKHSEIIAALINKEVLTTQRDAGGVDKASPQPPPDTAKEPGDSSSSKSEKELSSGLAVDAGPVASPPDDKPPVVCPGGINDFIDYHERQKTGDTIDEEDAAWSGFLSLFGLHAPDKPCEHDLWPRLWQQCMKCMEFIPEPEGSGTRKEGE